MASIIEYHLALLQVSLEAADPKPVLLISDFSMPRMNGMRLIGLCKALSPGLKTICFSGSFDPDSELEQFSVKPDLILRKPLPIIELVAAVEGLLAKEHSS